MRVRSVAIAKAIASCLPSIGVLPIHFLVWLPAIGLAELADGHRRGGQSQSQKCDARINPTLINKSYPIVTPMSNRSAICIADALMQIENYIYKPLICNQLK
jgi:hypothetical protein